MAITFHNNTDNKVHGANMGPIWGRQDPGGPHAGPMNFAMWEVSQNMKGGKIATSVAVLNVGGPNDWNI